MARNHAVAESTAQEYAPRGQLALTLTAPPAPRAVPRSPTPAPAIASGAADQTLTYAHWRYCTRREAATYIRCSPRFFDGLQLPYIRKGRCKVYDRVDLDAHMQDDKRRGRAIKEVLWPESADSINAKTRRTGGSTLCSPTDAEYAKALGFAGGATLKSS